MSRTGIWILRFLGRVILFAWWLACFTGCEDYRICPDYLDICPGISCVDLQTDGRHCGSCDKACGEGEVCNAGRCVGESHDADGDGYAAGKWGGDDCDDHDALVHPGANEICDGVDDDCDGQIDESPEAAESCDDGNECTDDECAAGGCLNANLDGTDCDDGDDCSMNDRCAGGECRGQPLDADGDGYVSAACGGDDCDDESAEVNPGVEEDQVPGGPLCSDGIDNDCDGLTDGEEEGCCMPDCSVAECGSGGCGMDPVACGQCTEGHWCIEGKCEEIGSEVVWVYLEGGSFTMGSEERPYYEAPAHQVTVPSFYMTKSEVTVAQYRRCVEAGACEEPGLQDTGECSTEDIARNWGITGRENYSVNCVSWNQATDYCGWIGGRLSSEAEWEYAARGGGNDVTYPWGEHIATCEYAVMDEGCHEGECCAAGCSDNDGDGYGIGRDCLGQDCDDSNPFCQSGECCLDCIDMDGDKYGIGPTCLGPDDDDADPECNTDCYQAVFDSDFDGYGRGTIFPEVLGPDCNDSDPSCWQGECCLHCLDIDGDYYGLGDECLGPDCREQNWREEMIPDHLEGCGKETNGSACSKPKGNTPQGLCDMAGNLLEWVQDWYHDSYIGAPEDGSAWEVQGNCTFCDYRVLRSASFNATHSAMRVTSRGFWPPYMFRQVIGIRCARSSE